MNERRVEVMLAGLDRTLPEHDVAAIRRLARFMDEHSAWITGHAFRGGVLRITFSDDAHSYTVSVKEMDPLLATIDRGDPFPWQELAMAETEHIEGPEE